MKRKWKRKGIAIIISEDNDVQKIHKIYPVWNNFLIVYLYIVCLATVYRSLYFQNLMSQWNLLTVKTSIHWMFPVIQFPFTVFQSNKKFVGSRLTQQCIFDEIWMKLQIHHILLNSTKIETHKCTVNKVTDLKTCNKLPGFFKSIQHWPQIIFHSILPVSTPNLQPTKVAGSKANIADFLCSCITIPSPGRNLRTASSVVFKLSPRHKIQPRLKVPLL